MPDRAVVTRSFRSGPGVERLRLWQANPARASSLVPPPTASPPIQPKLVVGAVDDPLEREADLVADQVMSLSDVDSLTRSAPGPLSRMSKGGGLEARSLRAKASEKRDTSFGEVPAIVNDVLHAPAQPLDSAIRGQFERQLHYDFAQVRVHSDGLASRSAASMDARAFTVGRDVVFGAGQYAPSTPGGKRLLAQELAHVAQQGAAGVIRREPISSAKLTPDPTRKKLLPQQIERIDGFLRQHQLVIFSREKRATLDGQHMSLAQAIGVVRREAGILLPSDHVIAAYIDSQFYKYLYGRGTGGPPPGGTPAPDGQNTQSLLRQGIPLPFGLDRPSQRLEPGLTGGDVDRIRTFLTTGGLTVGAGLQPVFQGGPTTLDQVTELCRGLVLQAGLRDKVDAVVQAEWTVLVRRALQLPLPPPPEFTISFDDPPIPLEKPGKPDKLVSTVGWQGTWHLVHAGKFESTIAVQLAQGEGSVTPVYQFQVNLTTGDVQALVGVQVQSPEISFKLCHAVVKASAFLQMVGGITNAGGKSASGSVTLQVQGGVQAVVTLGKVSATVQVGPTLTLQQGQSPDFSLTPAAQGGLEKLPEGTFPPFHGISIIRGTF